MVPHRGISQYSPPFQVNASASSVADIDAEQPIVDTGPCATLFAAPASNLRPVPASGPLEPAAVGTVINALPVPDSVGRWRAW